MPDRYGELTEYESKNIRQHLKRYLPNGCPGCGHDELNLSRGRVIPGDAHMEDGPGLTVEEYVTIRCRRCLQTMFYPEEIAEKRDNARFSPDSP